VMGRTEVLPASSIASVCQEMAIEMGVVAVPEEAAQEAVSALVEGGVSVIFNYAAALVRVPGHVRVYSLSPLELLVHALHDLNDTHEGLSARGRSPGPAGSS
jgi:redox-sensing transcriptional repressor